jgi:endonuclease/exonuclease/phosphatase (EEP) superfamily protein YafD
MKTNLQTLQRLVALTILLAGMSLPAAPVTQIKVMTLNIWVNASQGVNNIIQLINASGADVVMLQEADGYTIRPIANALGFYWTQTGGAGQYGVISRYPILKRIGETANAYGGVGVTIELSADQRAHIFSAHLNYTSYGPYLLQDGKTATFIINSENSVRMPGLNELLTLAAPFVGSAEPTFLAGDFNAPSHIDYASLNWPESLACINAGLFDSYAELHLGNRTYPPAFAYNEPGITWTPVLSQEPRGAFDRIDFVYYSINDSIVPTAATEINSTVSDHRAVISTFTLAMPAQQTKASSPIPAHNLLVAPLRPVMTWVPGTNTTSHNVYFGPTSPGTLQTNQALSKFSPGRLNPNTTYFWRVDEVKAGGTTTGDVWSFKTGNFAWSQPSKTTYAPNETISVTFGNGPSNKKDWIGIYAVGSAYGPGNVPALDWKYLNGSQAAPNKAVKNGTINFTGRTAGSYVVRFFANDGFTLLDEVPVSVTP